MDMAVQASVFCRKIRARARTKIRTKRRSEQGEGEREE